MVKIKFLARFKDITGEKKVEFDFNGELSGLIDVLFKKYGNKFKESLLNDEGLFRDYVKILINGEDIAQINGLKSPIHNDDEIIIFQTIAGG
jgi:molybdopterin synthase sulfur carrier subunit